MLYNHEKSRIAIGYDPARQFDNSVATVGEIYFDEQVGYKMRLINSVSFADIAKKKKTPMRIPEQMVILKQMILDYNGNQAADYEHLDALLIDAGSGGGGVNIADYFMEEWEDSNGNKHRGLIDKVESVDYISKFPNAINKIKLLSPQKYKKQLFEALIEMMNLDLISFPETYDNKGMLIMNDSNLAEGEFKEKIHRLSFEEEMALIQLDLAKEELVSIYRFESSNGNCRYDLPPDKKNKMNDDRAYTIAMLAWRLQEIRRENITNKKKTKTDISNYVFFN